MKLCGKKTALKEVLFSNNVQLTNATGQYCFPPAEATVDIMLCIPRLVKKEEQYYPKFAVYRATLS